MASELEPHDNLSLSRKRKQVDNHKGYEMSPNYNPKTPKKKLKATESAIAESSQLQNSKKGRKKAIQNSDGCEVVVEEKRLKRFRKHAPQSYTEIKARALTQRLTVLGRARCGTDDVPEENLSIAGSTGNVYTVHIGLIPRCDCPHALKGNQCKHIIYVMLRVLKAPEDIGYQLALTSGELRAVFKNAAPIPTADAEAASSDGNRKPIEGECPICYMEFEADKEAIVYCKAACGNNVHKECMGSWMRSCRGKPTCPYCRSQWIAEELACSSVDLQNATKNADGYVNVASQLGLSGERDYSSYHQHWVRRRFRGDRR